jgi:hypothetical protein
LGICDADASNFRLSSRADSVEKQRQCFLERARHEATYVREATGRNDHAAIAGYFRDIGYSLANVGWQGRAYCGAFIGAIAKRCGVLLHVKGPALTVNWLADRKWVTRVNPSTVAQAGDVAGYNFSGRSTGIDHVEIVAAWHPNPGFPYATFIAGNTSAPKGSGSLQGVYVKDRLKRQVKWIIQIFHV